MTKTSFRRRLAGRGWLCAASLSVLTSCVTPRAPLPTVVSPPVPVTRVTSLTRLETKDVPSFQDDLDTASLRTAAYQSLSYYQRLPPLQRFELGGDTYTVRDFSDSLATLLESLDRFTTPEAWRSFLVATFDVYQSVGTDADKTVVFSSYYEPVIPARLMRTSEFKYPFYRRPPDLIDVDLGLFDPAYQGAKIAGRRSGNDLVPYSTRGDIDSGLILKEKGLEIAWAKDPLDVLDMQIEGSGWLDFGKGDLRRIRYDGNNGKKYKSIGQHLISSGRIPARDFSRDAFVKYLTQHDRERQALLNINERYIFFRMDPSTAAAFAFGNIDVPLTPGRSIATDPKLFPKGALTWIETQGVRRFMLNQDEGGAIQGPGRVDIFAGSGEQATQFARKMWNKGKLYFLVKKKGGQSAQTETLTK